MSTAADHADQILDDWLLDPSLAPAAGDEVLAPLYDAAQRGEVMLPFCAACAKPLELEQDICDGCGGGDRSWRAVAPHGTVHAATLMHRREPGLVHARGPYPIVDVELDSGHRLVMTTARPTDTAPRIGTAVHIAFRRLGDVVIPAIDTLEEDA
ncbi:Zn-ribbon domain-containing OB-fold protein [Mycolicibacterium monacense]|uniref:ChsH2 C-terminal OB-fold domain-containing protein n=2 Tax=Mycobacteriaceae TaxID=1762 RepID=A0AAD1IZ18_MYCMB|nr:OB-fold domain-containing protein [Mycolicibacterium monacense]MDA4104699.1 3-ketoacyl-CoA thiolase [Mycolicibacterium monacense DSM 44395]ORB22732.1 3-ketoacyl-CoA thiolase [Mycolicibacterium monacense DSM 44395]QHP87615.1 OB-fold domain-containing protein [Mycolicibacterium monacense DSM 44395]BBZ59232.1 hypothetical protein MMON_05330 [Mycolicibacterium monacense]